MGLELMTLESHMLYSLSQPGAPRTPLLFTFNLE